jgi:hypothetical protein
MILKRLKTKEIALVALSITILSLLIVPVIGMEETRVYDGTISLDDAREEWDVTGLTDFMSADAYSFGKKAPIDYDESSGSPGYGDAPYYWSTYDNDEVTLRSWFDPNDPGIVLPPQPLPYVPWSQYQPYWTPNPGNVPGSPPYMPFPDESSTLPPMPIPNVYMMGSPATRWSIKDDSQHTHYPEWVYKSYMPSLPGIFQPFAVAEVGKSFSRNIEYNPETANWNYFGDYDAVKFWIWVDSSLTMAASDVYSSAMTGQDFFHDHQMDPPAPSDYLELGHVSLVDSSTGFSPFTIGFTVDPSNPNLVCLTDSSFNTARAWQGIAPPDPADIITFSHGPLPYINPIVGLPPGNGPVPLITDVVASPKDDTGQTRQGTSIPMLYSSGVMQYTLNSEFIKVITDVVRVSDNFHVTPSKYSLVDGGPFNDDILFNWGQDPTELSEGDVFVVSYDEYVPAHFATIPADQWLMIEMKVNWIELPSAVPVYYMNLFDQDGFQIGSWNLQGFPDFWEDFVPDSFFAEFACPLPSSYLTSIPGSDDTLLKIDDIACTEDTIYPDPEGVLNYIHAKDGCGADWNPDIDAAPLERERTTRVDFSIDFPTYSGTFFDPWLSIYGSQLLELVDPANSLNFVWLMIVPLPGTPLTLTKIQSEVIDPVPMIILVMDGYAGAVITSQMYAIGMDGETFDASVEFGTTDEYALMIHGIFSDGVGGFEEATKTFTHDMSWNGRNPHGDGLVNYIADGNYDVTMNIHEVSVSWEDLPEPPVISVIQGIDATHETWDATISWSAVPHATSYNVYRSDDDVMYTMIDTVTGTSFDESFAVNDTWYYKVTAVNSTGESDFSNKVTVTSSILKPGTPSITVTPAIILTNDDFSCAWHGTMNTVQYLVYIDDDPTVEIIADHLVATLAATARNWNSSFGTNGTYYFVVVSVSSQGITRASNMASIQVNLPPKDIFDIMRDWWNAILAFFASIIAFFLGLLFLAAKKARNSKTCVGDKCTMPKT